MSDAASNPRLDGSDGVTGGPTASRRLSVVTVVPEGAPRVAPLDAPAGSPVLSPVETGAPAEEGGRPEPETAGTGEGEGADDATGLAQPTHRRRSRWFELDPGCFGRAAMIGAGVAVFGATGVLALWRMRRLLLKIAAFRMALKRARRGWRTARHAWTLLQRVRRRIRPTSA